MADAQRGFGTPEWLIFIGALMFIFILWLSALYDPSIRWLHFFQAWMYIAAMLLSLRRNRWGYFIGISAGGLWDYINVFVTNFLRSGLINLGRWMHGQNFKPEQAFIAVPAWTGNLLLVIGCIWGYTRQKNKLPADAGRLVVAFVLCTGFFILDIAICQPRYLPLIPRLLHPHAL